MNCPVCQNVALTMTAREGIEIDYCPQCRGIWLDRGGARQADRAQRRPATLAATAGAAAGGPVCRAARLPPQVLAERHLRLTPVPPAPFPRDQVLDSSLAFLAEPYEFLSKRCRRYGSYLFELSIRS